MEVGGGGGKKMIMFLDDGFGTVDTLSLAKDLSQNVKSDLLNSGFIPKVDTSTGIRMVGCDFKCY